jgi:tetratricopeptide (TPR) repeat protein
VITLAPILIFVLVAALYFLLRGSAGTGKPPSFGSTDTLDAVLAAYRAGDYETALQLSEGLKQRGSETPEYCFFRGKSLYEIGKLEEAEASLRQSLTLEKDKRRRALSQEALGSVLLEQKRYTDAVACFEGCIADWPDRGCSHRAIAETGLRQGIWMAEALRRAQKAVEIDRAAHALTAEIHNVNLGMALATLAWATAVQSRDAAEVDRLTAAAVQLGDEDTKSVMSQVYCHAGLAYAVLGKRDECARHFEQAAAADPRGNFGRLAQQRLADLSSAR